MGKQRWDECDLPDNGDVCQLDSCAKEGIEIASNPTHTQVSISYLSYYLHLPMQQGKPLVNIHETAAPLQDGRQEFL